MPTKKSLVIIMVNSKIKAKLQIWRIIDTIKEKDGVLRGYKIKNETGYVAERLSQLVGEIEIKGSCNNDSASKNTKLYEKDELAHANEEMEPKKRVKTAAMDMIKGVSFNELED